MKEPELNREPTPFEWVIGGIIFGGIFYAILGVIINILEHS